ncbi:hypothetical protein EON63_07785 [archaeon]|nr:MAG: hypothetical protein EON63_07785 [archaeon]
MTFIFGRNPDLHIKDEQGNTIETIDLSPVSTPLLHCHPTSPSVV